MGYGKINPVWMRATLLIQIFIAVLFIQPKEDDVANFEIDVRPLQGQIGPNGILDIDLKCTALSLVR